MFFLKKNPTCLLLNIIIPKFGDVISILEVD